MKCCFSPGYMLVCIRTSNKGIIVYGKWTRDPRLLSRRQRNILHVLDTTSYTVSPLVCINIVAQTTIL